MTELDADPPPLPEPGSPDARVANEFLSLVMRRIRQDREPLDRSRPFCVRMDRSMGGIFAQLWFLTRGCTWDRSGSCTMCNYGASSAVTADEMVSFVRQGLASATKLMQPERQNRARVDAGRSELYVSPSGSLLDPVEVPAEARRRIFELVDRFPIARFSFETRPETVTRTMLREITGLLPTKQVAVGLGIESVDPWIRRFCVNKTGDPASIRQAAALLRDSDVEFYANVSLGTAFLSTREAIDDAARSIDWALRERADLVLVFPLHVKSNTLLAWLYERGEYQPPSLWSLVAVLQQVDRSLLPKVSISWYRADPSTATGVLASPITCPTCAPAIFDTLDAYRACPCTDTLDALSALRCECREQWEEQAEAVSTTSLPERVRVQYALLARHFGLDTWWTDNSRALEAEMTTPLPHDV